MPNLLVDGVEPVDQLKTALKSQKDANAKRFDFYYKSHVTDVIEDRTRMKTQLIGMLFPYSMIGIDEAILTESEVYTTTVTCKGTSSGHPDDVAQLFKIDAKYMINLIKNNPSATNQTFLNKLRQLSNKKVSRYAEQIQLIMKQSVAGQ